MKLTSLVFAALTCVDATMAEEANTNNLREANYESSNKWTIVYGDGYEANGPVNTRCQTFTHYKGQQLKWNRGWFTDCCVHFYDNNNCAGAQRGYSCKDWVVDATSTNLNSYYVSDCN